MSLVPGKFCLLRQPPCCLFHINCVESSIAIEAEDRYISYLESGPLVSLGPLFIEKTSWTGKKRGSLHSLRWKHRLNSKIERVILVRSANLNSSGQVTHKRSHRNHCPSSLLVGVSISSPIRPWHLDLNQAESRRMYFIACTCIPHTGPLVQAFTRQRHQECFASDKSVLENQTP